MIDDTLPAGSTPPLPETPAVPPVPPAEPGARRRRFARRWWVYARWIVVGLPVLALGVVVGLALFVFAHGNVFTSSEVLERPSRAALPFSWPLRLTRRVNLLLIGIDVTINDRRQVVPISRSDTLMLISFDPERDQISALSIPRDTRAMIPGVGVTRINAAYAFGGPSLTIRTVQEFLSVPIHFYVKLGPESFARFIDAIGGVEIDVEKDMQYIDKWAGLYINLKKGHQLLNGEQAMGYIRFRHDALGDIARVERQQKVLLALFEKLKSPATVLSAPQLVRAFAEHTQTNLTMSELITLGVFTSRLSDGDLRVSTLPGTFGATYWEPDTAKIRQVRAEMFYGVDAQMLASTAIEVLNASGVPGLARQTAQRLERLGFHIVRVENSPTIAERTTIIDRAGRPQVARLLADLLGQKLITRQPGEGPDITVVVARDLAAQQRSRAEIASLRSR